MGIEINYNLQKWYNDLNDFLLKAEKVFNCKIIIIPHPKVKNIKIRSMIKILKFVTI